MFRKKKTDYKTKITKIEKKLTDHDHDKYSTTPEFSKLAQENLVTKTDFRTKLISLNRKIDANKKKHLLVENELKKLKAIDLFYREK